MSATFGRLHQLAGLGAGGRAGGAVIYTAYARRDGALVLVPDCLVASREAHARHGPLAFVGRIDDRDWPDARIWRRVLDDVDRQSYAVVRSSARGLISPASRFETA